MPLTNCRLKQADAAAGIFYPLLLLLERQPIGFVGRQQAHRLALVQSQAQADKLAQNVNHFLANGLCSLHHLESCSCEKKNNRKSYWVSVFALRATVDLLEFIFTRAWIGLTNIMPTIMMGKMEMELPTMYIMNRFIGTCSHNLE